MSVMSNEVLGCLYLTLRKTGVQHVFDVVFRGGLWLGLQVITLENLLSLAGQNKASAGGGVMMLNTEFDPVVKIRTISIRVSTRQ